MRIDGIQLFEEVSRSVYVYGASTAAQQRQRVIALRRRSSSGCTNGGQWARVLLSGGSNGASGRVRYTEEAIAEYVAAAEAKAGA